MINKFSITNENKILKNCTISHELSKNIICFSLAQNTDISPEKYFSDILHISLMGKSNIIINDKSMLINHNEVIIIPANITNGIKAITDTIYLEISAGKEKFIMNEAVKPGEIFKLSELVPYQPGKIVNMDIAHNNKMKFALMSFDAGTALSEHAAPGDALIFALDGEGIIGYEGQEFTIKSGENFRFSKNGKHYIKAVNNFKMALLLTLD